MPVSIRQHVIYPTVAKTPAGKLRKWDYKSKEARGRPWTESEVKTLKELYGVVTSAQIAQRINRTELSVNHRAVCLGLRPKGLRE